MCRACGRDPSAPAARPPEVAKPSWERTAGAVAFVGAGVLDIVSGLLLLTSKGEVSGLDIDLTGMLLACGTLAVIFGLFAFMAAALSYWRQNLGLLLVAAALAMVGGGPFFLGTLLALIGLVLAVRDNGEFRG